MSQTAPPLPGAYLGSDSFTYLYAVRKHSHRACVAQSGRGEEKDIKKNFGGADE